jgi:hypothetical protein
MIQAALSAILVTIATPLQFGLTIFTALPAGLICRRVIKSKKFYPYLDVEAAEERIKFCLRVYGSDHPQTKLAHLELQTVISRHWRAKRFTLEDLLMFRELGTCTQAQFERLTRNLRTPIL